MKSLAEIYIVEESRPIMNDVDNWDIPAVLHCMKNRTLDKISGCKRSIQVLIWD